VVDGSQDACGNCHGYPPLAPHPNDTNCGSCHPTVQPNSTIFLDPDSHIDGKLDITGNVQGCESCHGGGGVSAPPVALDGSTERTSRGVGAHREHLGPSLWRRELYCSQCHVVPINVGEPQHIDGDNRAELNFDALNPQATYDPVTNTCSNLYCHGNGRAARGTMTWTDDVELGCSSCHDDGSAGGATMSGEHDEHIQEGLNCHDCHGAVVDQNKNIIDPKLHINGVHEIDIRTGGTWNAAERRCSNLACHGAEEW
jgi:predicted CxxxxCH...CXXCH cytochrome family protein